MGEDTSKTQQWFFNYPAADASVSAPESLKPSGPRAGGDGFRSSI